MSNQDQTHWEKLEVALPEICEFLNDIFEGTRVIAEPGRTGITWKYDYPGKGAEMLAQRYAYKELVKAGFNPGATVEAAYAMFLT